MLIALGIVVVLGSVALGYMMEKGNFSLLFQPAEFVIIFGAASGALLISAPGKLVKLILKDIGKLMGGDKGGKESHLELLLVLYQIFVKIRKEGLISIESDVERPERSPILQKCKSIISNPKLRHFICDNFRVIIATNMPPHELDSLLDIDIEAHHQEALRPSSIIAKIADSLPGLGIVAAVLGVVLTMGKIGEPPEVLGHHIGAALVGTFLGVLACYGLVSPIATNLELKANENVISFYIIKAALVAFSGSAAPQIAVETGRRAIPSEGRPTFTELEEAMKKWKSKL